MESWPYTGNRNSSQRGLQLRMGWKERACTSGTHMEAERSSLPEGHCEEGHRDVSGSVLTTHLSLAPASGLQVGLSLALTATAPTQATQQPLCRPILHLFLSPSIILDPRGKFNFLYSMPALPLGSSAKRHKCKIHSLSGFTDTMCEIHRLQGPLGTSTQSVPGRGAKTH